MIFLHKVSKDEKSLLDTPLEQKKVQNYFHSILLTPRRGEGDVSFEHFKGFNIKN